MSRSADEDKCQYKVEITAMEISVGFTDTFFAHKFASFCFRKHENQAELQYSI